MQKLLVTMWVGFASLGTMRAQESMQQVTAAVAEQIPQYRYGTEGLAHFLSQRVKYPKKARKNRVEGLVYIRFLVDSTGALQALVIDQSLGSGCDEEALRVIRSTAAWIPGRKEGCPIAMQCVVPAPFKR